MQCDNNSYHIDGEGYLEDAETWSEEYATAIAKEDGLELTKEHWEIIHLLRDYWEEYEIVPNIRGLSKVVSKRLGEDMGDVRYLHEMFPDSDSPAKALAKYAGLPKPTGCL